MGGRSGGASSSASSSAPTTSAVCVPCTGSSTDLPTVEEGGALRGVRKRVREGEEAEAARPKREVGVRFALGETKEEVEGGKAVESAQSKGGGKTAPASASEREVPMPMEAEGTTKAMDLDDDEEESGVGEEDAEEDEEEEEEAGENDDYGEAEMGEASFTAEAAQLMLSLLNGDAEEQATPHAIFDSQLSMLMAEEDEVRRRVAAVAPDKKGSRARAEVAPP